MKTNIEMNSDYQLEMNNPFRNETASGNEPEMNAKNELEMNNRNGVEMNAGNELEMNAGNEPQTLRGNEPEMNQYQQKKVSSIKNNKKHIPKNTKNNIQEMIHMEYTEKELIKKVESIEDKEIREQILKIIKENPVYLDINEAKKEVQEGYTEYIYGIKFVTNENPETVLKTIKKDLQIYSNIERILIRRPIIDVMLNNNATLYSYYFLDGETLEQVLEKLPSLNKQIRILK